jgi:hypothetical protein
MAGDSLELPCAVWFPYFQTRKLSSKIIFMICGRLFGLIVVFFHASVIVVVGASVSQSTADQLIIVNQQTTLTRSCNV